MSFDPVAFYGAKVMPKGFRIHGDTRTGIKATVPYLLDWINADGFVNAILAPITTVVAGPLTFTAPYQFQGARVPVYAQRYTMEPCGVDPNGLVSMPTQGLLPGEFFSHAIVTVEFETIPFAFSGFDDPNGLNQLDPANPITLCEQSVKIGGKMVTRKGLQYIYSDDSKPVQGDVGVLETEAKLILKFPKVPYLPWQLLIPYTGRVNSAPVLLCDVETLRLDSPDTTAKPSLNSPTPIEQSVTLEFSYDPLGWNTAPKPDGSRVKVWQRGASGTKSKYDLVDFRQIFNTLSFSQNT